MRQCARRGTNRSTWPASHGSRVGDQTRVNTRSQTPWPSFRPRCSNLVSGRYLGPRCVTVGGVAQRRLAREHLQHLPGIGLPVGRAMQRAARAPGA